MFDNGTDCQGPEIRGSTMKIKGIKSIVSQVTFKGDKHPNTGSVFTLDWYELKNWIELHLNTKDKYNKDQSPDQVISLKISPRGLEVYHENIQHMAQHYTFRERLLGKGRNQCLKKVKK